MEKSEAPKYRTNRVCPLCDEDSTELFLPRYALGWCTGGHFYLTEFDKEGEVISTLEAVFDISEFDEVLPLPIKRN